MPEWARRERRRDMEWIQENFHVLWPAAHAAFEDQGRGALVVDTTSQPLPEKGHPFGYFPEKELEQMNDEDVMRMVKQYRPDTEMVVVMLKPQERMSTYRVQSRPRSN